MQLILYSNFSKRKNSTKQPTGGTTYDVRMKAGCSTENPVFLIDGVNLNANYAQWNGAYYFVDEIIIGNNNIYELHCSIDILATYKTMIGASTQFIERAASAYDDMVSDPLLSTSNEISGANSANTTLSILDADGCYLIRTFSRNGVNIYGYSDMSGINGILNNTSYGISDSNLQALVQTIGANIFDVSAYVTNVMWLPIALSNLTGSNAQVSVGFWNLSGFTAKKITQREITGSFTVAKPTNVYSDFRAYDPAFSKYNIRLPGVGVVQIPSIYFNNNIQGVYCIDIMTGQITYKLYSVTGSNTRSIIGRFSGMLGVEIPYSTSHLDVLGLGQQILNPSGAFSNSVSYGGGGSAASMGGALAGIIGGSVDFAFGVTRATFDTAQSINNGAGNMSDIKNNLNIVTTVINIESKEFPLTEAGRPLYEHKQISTLSGFIRCNGASLDTPAHGNEKNTLNAYLNSGFYYE